MTRRDSVESRRLDVLDAKLLAVSSTGDLAFLRGPRFAETPAPEQGRSSGFPLLAGVHGKSSTMSSRPIGGLRGNDLAVVRRGQVEFPVGNKIHGPHGSATFESRRMASGWPYRRAWARCGWKTSSSGDCPARTVGRRTTLSSGGADLATLAWSPAGDEVWFTQPPRRLHGVWALRAVSLDGKERCDLSVFTGLLSIHDVSSGGRVCSRRPSAGWDARA